MMQSDTQNIAIHAAKSSTGENVLSFNAPTIDEVEIVTVGD